MGACTNNALTRCCLWRCISIASSQLLQHSRTDQRGPSAGLRGRQARGRAAGRTQVESPALEHHTVLIIHTGALGEDEQRGGVCRVGGKTRVTDSGFGQPAWVSSEGLGQANGAGGCQRRRPFGGMATVGVCARAGMTPAIAEVGVGLRGAGWGTAGPSAAGRRAGEVGGPKPEGGRGQRAVLSRTSNNPT